MTKMLLAAFLLAAPAAAFAQNHGGMPQANTQSGSTSAARPSPTGNLNNPQAQANQAGQPGNARTLPSSGDASSIPVPVAPGQPMARVPKQTTPAK